MKRVYLWAADKAGCWTYRMKFPMQSVLSGPNGSEFEIDSDPRIPQDWIDKSEVVVGQRVCKPAPSRLWQRWAKEGSKRLVFEMDDDLWHVDPENTNAYDCFKDPEIRANLVRNIQVSDTVTVSTEPLADVVRKETGHSDVRVIPNAVPEWLLEHEAAVGATTGYMGSPTHHRDIKPVSRHFKRFFESNPGATFHAIGFDYGEFMGIPEKQRRYTPWVPDVENALKTIDYAFGVAPLTASMFARSKSDLKAIEMAALGRPCIVSNTAPYSTIQNGKTGLVVRYEHEWLKSLRAMHEDEAMRVELGANAKEWVRSERTLDKVRSAWEAAYTG